MSTLVSFMLALVMKILSTFTTSSTEISTVIPDKFIQKTEVVFLEQRPTVTPIKNC